MNKLMVDTSNFLILNFLRLVGPPVQTVWAHPHNELQQSLYVTPTPEGVTLEVQLVPGVMVCREFIALLDANSDGVISETEISDHVESVVQSLAVQFGNSEVPLRLLDAAYPSVERLRTGGGTIRIEFAADAPAGETRHEVTVTNRYDPVESVPNLAITLSRGHAVEVGNIQRGEAGRRLSFQYSPMSLATR